MTFLYLSWPSPGSHIDHITSTTISRASAAPLRFTFKSPCNGLRSGDFTASVPCSPEFSQWPHQTVVAWCTCADPWLPCPHYMQGQHIVIGHRSPPTSPETDVR